MTSRLRRGIVFGFLALLANKADACRDPESAGPGILRLEAPPPQDEGLIVAEVEVVTDYRVHGLHSDARILRLIQGDYKGDTLRFDNRPHNSCESPPYPRSRGFIVGRVIGMTDSALIIDAIRSPPMNEARPGK